MDEGFVLLKSAPRSQRKRDLYRFVVARSDITAALRTAELLLRHADDWSSELFAPLYHATAVAYARPFAANKPHGPLPGKWTRFDNDRHQRTHDSLIDARHTYIAHSDAAVRRVEITPEHVVIPGIDRRVGLSVRILTRYPEPEYFELVRETCLDVGGRLNDAVHELLDELYQGMALPDTTFPLRIDEGL